MAARQFRSFNCDWNARFSLSVSSFLADSFTEMFAAKMTRVGGLLDELAQKDKNSAKVFKQSLSSIDPIVVRKNLAENLKIRLDDHIEPKLNGLMI